MRYEELQGIMVPKVGFGTWSFGGGTRADRRGCRSPRPFKVGVGSRYTHFDTAEYYAGGHCEELLGRAVRMRLSTEAALFLTSKVKAETSTRIRVLEGMGSAQAARIGALLDLYLIHWPSRQSRAGANIRGPNDLSVRKVAPGREQPTSSC
jgi:diketogulonate reductase-like aldo/keto reductase